MIIRKTKLASHAWMTTYYDVAEGCRSAKAERA